MSDTDVVVISGVVGDESRTVGFYLQEQNAAGAWVGIDLSSASIEARLRQAYTGQVVTIADVPGTADGLTTTDLDSVSEPITAGEWTIEWKIQGGRTYPAKATDRPYLHFREEVTSDG